MPRVAEQNVPIAELSFRVLLMPNDRANPATAAEAVHAYLERRRPALAGAVTVSPGQGAVVLRAEGEAPEDLVAEAAAALRRRDLEPLAGELEVDAAEFDIQLIEAEAEPEPAEREIITSDVRYFPYPECEWFEVRNGRLTLSERRIVFEPRLIIAESPDAEAGSRHVTPLSEVQKAYRGEWWNVPCLMVQTSRITYRYAWPARRGELALVFDVDEWLGYLRSLVQQRE